MNKELTFLSYEDCIGDTKLEILQQNGLSAGITDFCILTGGCKENKYDSSEEWKSDYWLSSVDEIGDPLYNNHKGRTCHIFYPSRAASCRPVLNYIPSEINSEDLYVNENNALETKYLEYAQGVVPKNFARILEQLHNHDELMKTERIYTVDGEPNFENYTSDFIPRDYSEFMFNNKKYIRIRAHIYKGENTLSDGTLVKTNDIVWVEVSPLKWLVDLKSNKLIAKDSFVAGIKLDKTKVKYETDFKNTEMYYYLNNYMLPQLMGKNYSKNYVNCR